MRQVTSAGPSITQAEIGLVDGSDPRSLISGAGHFLFGFRLFLESEMRTHNAIDYNSYQVLLHTQNIPNPSCTRS